jgi:threonine/homoserine/homoserine lactone efflux protein
MRRIPTRTSLLIATSTRKVKSAVDAEEKSLYLQPVNFPAAFMIGFSVASIPGPTGVLIATQTLRHGARAGLFTMLAPLALDVFIMLPLGLFLQASLFTGNRAAVLGLSGAAFLLWLGTQSIRAGIREKDKVGRMKAERENSSFIPHPSSSTARRSGEMSPFLKGLFTHVTSPYPYLFWATVGGSFVRRGFENSGISGAAIFPAGFWTGTTTFTLMLIYLVAHGKKLLPPRIEPYLHHVSGVLLLASGIYLAVSVWHGLF